MHRNIGNQVPGNDLNALSVLEYAVQHLHVTDIIVVGPYYYVHSRYVQQHVNFSLLFDV